jgi:hypothetical protein
MSVAQYTYLATDLVTNKILGELPVNGVSLDCQLNSAGNMSAGGHLSDKRIDDAEFIARTIPGRTAFWAIRENTIVWGGAILSRTYQSNGKSLSLTGQTFECYANRRFPREVIGTQTETLTMGQSAMIAYLWSEMQSTPHGSINVRAATPPPVDPSTTLTVNGYDLSTSYGDLITSVTQLANGPDWTIGWGMDQSGNPYKQLITGAPIGNTIDVTDLIVDYPGSVLNYSYTENASSGANNWWAVGDGTGATTTTGNATDPISLASGWPLWESVNNYSGVTVQSTINSHAQSDLTTFPMPFLTHSAQFVGEPTPSFGTYGLGDFCIVNVVDPRFPSPGQTFKVRVIGWSIQPPDEGNGTETITPVFDEPTGGQ